MRNKKERMRKREKKQNKNKSRKVKKLSFDRTKRNAQTTMTPKYITTIISLIFISYIINKNKGVTWSFSYFYYWSFVHVPLWFQNLWVSLSFGLVMLSKHIFVCLYTVVILVDVNSLPHTFSRTHIHSFICFVCEVFADWWSLKEKWWKCVLSLNNCIHIDYKNRHFQATRRLCSVSWS